MHDPLIGPDASGLPFALDFVGVDRRPRDPSMRQAQHRLLQKNPGARLGRDYTGGCPLGRAARPHDRAADALLFCRHTSASLLIQENADPTVRTDIERFFERIAPEGGGYVHQSEGPDDMPAHLRVALTQTSLSVPLGEGRLLLGTWQGLYLFEHRARPHERGDRAASDRRLRPARPRLDAAPAKCLEGPRTAWLRLQRSYVMLQTMRRRLS